MSTAVLHKAYQNSVLKPEVHARLVSDLDGVAREANIPAHFVWTSATKWCSDIEQDYLKNLRKHSAMGLHGMVYTGVPSPQDVSVSERMFAITGACLRNFVGAKVMPLHDVLSALKDEDSPTQRVICVPNFYTREKQLVRRKGGPVADWQLPALLGWLYERMSNSSYQTILYVQDMDGMAEDYGTLFHQHLTRHFYQFKF